MPVLQTGLAKSAAADYTIDQSLRFEDGGPAYLSRTPGSAGDQKTWTFSCWLKRGTNFGSWQRILSAAVDGSNAAEIAISPDTGFLRYEDWFEDGTQYLFWTDRLFRDPSAWYHILFVYDTTETTSTNRFKFYINGELETGINTNNAYYDLEQGEHSSDFEFIELYNPTGDTKDLSSASSNRND